MSLVTTARNATLQDLAAILQDQHGRKVDIVAPAAAIRSVNGLIVVAGAEEILDETGVTVTDGTYRPTAIFDGHAAEKLGIPIRYLRRMREERPDLYDANVNGWLHGNDPTANSARAAAPDDRSFMLRAFRGEDGIGVARAMLSDRYGIIDDIDVLTASLAGIQQAGVPVEVIGCDLTESRMYVQIACPAIEVLAPALLAGYRSPFLGGQEPWNTPEGRAHGWLAPDERPVVFAGFGLSNSEVGGGAFTITPRIIVKACRNGLTFTKDAVRAIHVGGRLDDGVVRWSRDTQEKQLAVITAKARDAVAAFLDPAYVARKVAGLEAAAAVPVRDAVATVERVGKDLAFSERQTAGILDFFVRGGQLTAGGVMQAVTAYAQTMPDADDAYETEAKAMRALELVAAS